MPGSNTGLRAGAGSLVRFVLGIPGGFPIPWGNCTSICVTYPDCPWLWLPEPMGQVLTLQDQAQVRDVLAQVQPHAGAVEALRALEGSNTSNLGS